MPRAKLLSALSLFTASFRAARPLPNSGSMGFQRGHIASATLEHYPITKLRHKWKWLDAAGLMCIEFPSIKSWVRVLSPAPLNSGGMTPNRSRRQISGGPHLRYQITAALPLRSRLAQSCFPCGPLRSCSPASEMARSNSAAALPSTARPALVSRSMLRRKVPSSLGRATD